MDSTTLTRQHKLDQWTELIRNRQESGQTISQWCEENSISPAKYYYWLKRVRQNACDHLPAISKQMNAIVPVSLDEPILQQKDLISQSYSMRISLNEISLEFTNDASPQLIENALRVLTHVR